MVQRICPMCEQTMNSAHYCSHCRSWVRHPYVRDVNYYLNERHPGSETDCSYHGTKTDTGGGNPMSGRQSQPHTPLQPHTPPQPPHTLPHPQPTSRPGISRTQSPLGQNWVPQPQGRKNSSENMSSAANRPTARKRGFGLWGLLVVIILFGGQALPAFLNWTGSSVIGRIAGDREQEYDVDMGEYIGDEDGYIELEDDVVIAGEMECTGLGHFPVTGDEMRQQVLRILSEQGYEIDTEDEYSYNERNQEGDSTYESWISVGVISAEDDAEIYQYVDVDYDTATGLLHGVTISLSDKAKETAVTGEVLKAMEQYGAIAAESGYPERVAEDLPGRIDAFEDYLLQDGTLLVEGLTYEDNYTVYISHTIEE